MAWISQAYGTMGGFLMVQEVGSPGGTSIRFIVGLTEPFTSETALTSVDFRIVRWDAVAETIPAMFALTFFGILHVPINVPSLAFSVGEDNLDLDRELIAHGISNALSGFAGSIQNYLVYTNSVLFKRSGGDGRLAGILLAMLTFGVLLIGPVIIGYIPVMVVGVLILVLGFELFLEAIWLPRKKLKKLEYLTVRFFDPLGLERI